MLYYKLEYPRVINLRKESNGIKQSPVLRKKLWIQLGPACPLNILIQLAEALGFAEAIDSYYISGWDWVNISFDQVNFNFNAPGFSGILG